MRVWWSRLTFITFKKILSQCESILPKILSQISPPPTFSREDIENAFGVT